MDKQRWNIGMKVGIWTMEVDEKVKAGGGWDTVPDGVEF